MAVYVYSDEEKVLSQSLLLILHVFFSNILLMNFLIAILSTTYENMQQSGIFKYKTNLFQYCEMYINAFNEDVYGELVLHPPPLSYIASIMLPFVVSKALLKRAARFFAFLMFWLENILFLAIFFLFELLLMPVAYCKIWFNIIKNSLGVLNTVLNIVFWLFLGIFISFFLALRDTYYLFRIFLYHHGCRFGRFDDNGEVELDPQTRVHVYNEVREAVINLYKQVQDQNGELLNEVDDDLDFDPDFFRIEENENEDYQFVVKKNTIIEQWKKRRTLKERQKRLELKKDQSSKTGLKNALTKSMKKKIGLTNISIDSSSVYSKKPSNVKQLHKKKTVNSVMKTAMFQKLLTSTQKINK